MQIDIHPHRNEDGSIDFDFYRRQASRARREARNESLRDAFATLKQIARTLGARNCEAGLKTGAARS